MGVILLRKFVEANGDDCLEEFHRVTLWRWLNGKRKPATDYAINIEELTEGAVPMKSWKIPAGET